MATISSRRITGKPAADESYLSTAELAARWRMAPITLAKHRSSDTGPRYRKLPNGRILYPLSEILKAEGGAT